MVFNPNMIKKRRRKYFKDCETITFGYIDLLTEKNKKAMSILAYMTIS